LGSTAGSHDTLLAGCRRRNADVPVIAMTGDVPTKGLPMTPELPLVIRQAIDAANLGNTAAFVAAFRPHRGCVDDWGRKHFGNEAIRRWTETELIAKHAIKVINFYIAGGGVVVIAHVDGHDFHGAATFTFHLHGEHIIEMEVTA
jgi:hypothetical protein